MICWAPWFSQVHSTGLLSVFLEHSLMYLWWYYFLICFVSYSWLIRTLSYSKLVEKKLITDKTEMNHNIQWCPLINFLQSFIHNYDNTLRQYHKQQLTRASQCFRKTKIQSSSASFILFWQSKQKWHHFRTWWKMKINNLSFKATLRLQSVTLELGSIARITLTCGLQPPFPCPFQYWPQTWDNSTEKTILKKYCERERQVSEQCDPRWESLIVASHTDVLWQFQNETVFSTCTS